MSDLFKGVDISWKPFLEGEFQKDYMKKIKTFLIDCSKNNEVVVIMETEQNNKYTIHTGIILTLGKNAKIQFRFMASSNYFAAILNGVTISEHNV